MDQNDVTELEKYINNEKELTVDVTMNSDLNGDSKIDEMDKELLIKYLSGEDITFPCE